MIRRPPRSTLFPYTRSSDLGVLEIVDVDLDAVHARRRAGERAGLGLALAEVAPLGILRAEADRKSTRLNSSHSQISYAVFCLKKKKKNRELKFIIDMMCIEE